MSSLYQPPLFPGAMGGSSLANGGAYAPTRSPHFTISNQFLPRNLHDVIRWVRFITMHSPVTTEVLRKLATYPITDFDFDTEDDQLREKYKDLVKSVNLTTTLHQIGFQYFTIGNVFISVYKPIRRTLVCSNQACNFTQVLDEATQGVVFKNYAFHGTCPKCNSNQSYKILDTKNSSMKEMNLILWDPTHVVVNHNPISGKSTYYYTIPNDVKRRIMEGDLLFLSTIPWEFVEAVKTQKNFRFSNGSIFHLKNVDTGFSANGISIPPLITHFNLVFYQATLRKANESIAGDYMTPTRVVFPSAQSGNSDPVVSLSMRNFATKMEEAFVRRKTDPNSIVISPVPIGYQAISGEGKTLLVSQEIQQAEQSLLLSLGVSMELLSGSTNWTSSTVGLRLLKKTLESYTSQLEGFLDWFTSEASSYFGFKNVPTSLIPFQLTDDEMVKQIMLSLSSTGKVSMHTIFNAMGKSYDEEIEHIREESIAMAKSDVRLQYEVSQAKFAEASLIQSEVKNRTYNDALKEVQATIAEIKVMPPEMVAQVLQQIRVNSFAKYILLLDELQKEANESANIGATMPTAAVMPGDPNDPNSQPGAGGEVGPDGMPIDPGMMQPTGMQGPQFPSMSPFADTGGVPVIGQAQNDPAMGQVGPGGAKPPGKAGKGLGNLKSEGSPGRDISGSSKAKPKG